MKPILYDLLVAGMFAGLLGAITAIQAASCAPPKDASETTTATIYQREAECSPEAEGFVCK